MALRYLLHFAHEHVSFRWVEFMALTSKNNCKFKLISKYEHIETRPFIVIELFNGASEAALVQSARDSYLIKGLYELWAHSTVSIEHLASVAGQCQHFLSGIYRQPENSFRLNCESFGCKLTQSTKVEWMRKMLFLNSFKCKPDLKSPKQTYSIMEMNEKDVNLGPEKEFYFGRLVTSGDRAAIHKLNLKERVFIANTSMDPLLSLVACNCAKVNQNDLVYDPFVGSGGLLVAAAYKGAYVLGADIDWLLLHGKSRPSRKGQKSRELNESVRMNLRQYGLEDRYLDVAIADISRSPFADNLVVDSIISDPPYGVRECSEKVGLRRERRPLKDYTVRYPSKTVYTLTELLGDLLSLSASRLAMSGRLIYYLPVIKSELGYKEVIPTHPCLELVAFCEQELTAKTSRLMVVMEKVKSPEAGDSAVVPQVINEMNFRETYFSRSERAD